MEKHLLDSIFVFKAKKLCCMPSVENVKKSLLEHTGIAEVDADLEKNTLMIKANMDIVKLITIIQESDIDAELVYYKKDIWEEDDHQPTEDDDERENDCFCHSNQDEEKDHQQRKERRGKKEKVWDDDDEAEDIGAEHYKIRNTFKDHKPEKYVPPKEAYYWGDVRSGMHKKFPMMSGAASWFTAGFPNYNGYYYPAAPWPQDHYM